MQCPQLCVEATDVVEMLERQRVAGGLDRIGWTHGREESSDAIGRDFLGNSARHQLRQQVCNRHAAAVRALPSCLLRFADSRNTAA